MGAKWWAARWDPDRTLATQLSYYRRLWMGCAHETGGAPFRVSKRPYPVGAGFGRETPPMLKIVDKQDDREAGAELLLSDEIVREGARRMLIEALRAEAADYVERHRGERDEHEGTP